MASVSMSLLVPASALPPPPVQHRKEEGLEVGCTEGRVKEISLKSKQQSLWGLERTHQHRCEASRSGTLASVFTYRAVLLGILKAAVLPRWY